MIDLKGKVILLFGGYGFLGQYLKNELNERTNESTFRPSPSTCNLLKYEDVEKTFDYVVNRLNCKYVVHAAGYNGNMFFNQQHPADIFYINTVMGLNVLRACQQFGIKKVVSVLASCAYDTVLSNNAPLKEEDYLLGGPHISVQSHGYAKRNLLIGSNLYRSQYGLNAITVIPTTIYGPLDSLDLDRTKVMMSLIKKIWKAKINNQPKVEMVGTGSSRRQFIYCNDVATKIVDCLEYYDEAEPINLATDGDVSIKELVEIIKEEARYDGEIVWDNDTSKDGQFKKELDTSKMKSALPERMTTSLRVGIKKTIDWLYTL